MPDVAVFHFDQGGQEAQCTFAFTTSETNGTAVANAFRLNMWDIVKARTAANCTLQKVVAYLGGEPGEVTVNEGGSAGSTTLPITCALLVQKHTIAGRNGRLFWPGLPEVDVDEAGRLSGLALTNWQAAWDGARAAMDASTVSMMVYRDTPTPTYVQVDRLDVRPYIGTQRRRLH